MPCDFRSRGWQDLSGDSSDGISSDYGYRGAVMDLLKTVCTLPGRCQVNVLILCTRPRRSGKLGHFIQCRCTSIYIVWLDFTSSFSLWISGLLEEEETQLINNVGSRKNVNARPSVEMVFLCIRWNEEDAYRQCAERQRGSCGRFLLVRLRAT